MSAYAKSACAGLKRKETKAYCHRCLLPLLSRFTKLEKTTPSQERIPNACTVCSSKMKGMEPYSQDLRQKIIEALESDEDPQAEIADNFGVSLSFVEKLWHRWRHSGRCAALPRSGGQKRALQDSQDRLRAEVVKQPDATLSELCERVAKAGGASASPSMMCRELQRLQLPRKKRGFLTARVRLRG